MSLNDSTGGIQHGGQHYKHMGIQPIDYGEENKLTPTEYTIVRYVTRHRHKEGWLDVQKAFHFMQMLARRFYNREVEVIFHEPVKSPGFMDAIFDKMIEESITTEGKAAIQTLKEISETIKPEDCVSGPPEVEQAIQTLQRYAELNKMP